MPQSPNILDRILELVQKNGPALPVDVASKLGLDSFLASAYMQQLVEAGKLHVGKEKIGGSQIFFVAGQESAANTKVKNLIETSKKTARMFAKDVPNNPAVQQKRDAFSTRLKEIEAREVKTHQRRIVEPLAIMEPGHKVIPITLKSVSQEVVGSPPDRAVGGQMMPKPKPVEEAKKPDETKPEQIVEVEEVRYEAPKLEAPPEPEKPKSIAREVIEKTFFKKPEKPMEPGPLVDAAMAMLVDSGVEIISKELKKKGKEADIVFDLPTKIGNIKMLAVIRNKKSISEADLSMAYTEGVNRKMFVVFITDGKMTKTAHNYHQVIAGLLKFKTIESK